MRRSTKMKAAQKGGNVNRMRNGALMTESGKTSRKSGPDARLPALVIALSACLWLGGLVLGGALGLPPRFAILLDLGCLAAFVWALIVTIGIWRKART